MRCKHSLDDKIVGFVDKYLDWIIFAFMLVMSIHIRLKYTPLIEVPGWSDYKEFLQSWVEHYANLGIVRGLGEGIGDYYIPYNIFLAILAQTGINPVYGISFFSCAFDYIMALVIYNIIRVIRNKEGVISIFSEKFDKCIAIALINLPFVIINSALWKQCDSIYCTFLLLSILYFIKEKPNLTFIMLGIAFTFKFQAVFLIPFYIIAYYIKRNFSIIHTLWVPFMYLITGLPAIFCGRSITNTYGIYYRQIVATGGETVVSFPAIWFIGFQEKMFRDMALLVTLMIFAMSMLFIQKNLKGKNVSAVFMLSIVVWCIMTAVEFLPGMHERYDYLAVLLISCISVFFNKRLLIPALIMNICCDFSYGRLLTQTGGEYYPIIAIAYFVAYVWVSYELYKHASD